MVLALIGSVAFILVMTVGWSWLEARRDRRRVADSRASPVVASGAHHEPRPFDAPQIEMPVPERQPVT